MFIQGARSRSAAFSTPFQGSKRRFHLEMEPLQGADFRKTLTWGRQKSSTFDKLYGRLDGRNKFIEKDIKQRAQRFSDRARGPDNYLDPQFEASKIEAFMLANARKRGHTISMTLSTRYFVDMRRPGNISIGSIRTRDLHKAAHEMQHALDLQSYPALGEDWGEIGNKIKTLGMEWRAFRTQKRVARDLNLDPDVPYGSPFRAAYSYWDKSRDRYTLE